ncbi:hypothetical protein H6G36_29180 [Anabaena minutissima FACHB-250]|nr:hypothetical protein [Anabaena minutissima FACHB-250]
MKNYLDVILGVSAIVTGFAGFIWWVAQIKWGLEKAIAVVNEAQIERIRNIEHQLALHLTEYSGKREFLDYHLHSLNEKIDHKFSRCWTEIKQNQAFLSKQGFVPRDENTL